MPYDSVDQLQRALAEDVFHYAKDAKKPHFLSIEVMGIRGKSCSGDLFHRPYRPYHDMVQHHRTTRAQHGGFANATRSASPKRLENNTLTMTAGRAIVSQNQDWGTPRKYVDAIRGFFGGTIHLDPCSNCHSIVGAEVEYRLPHHDGLRESWNYPTIFVNPPYGLDRENGTSIKRWLARCEQAHRLYQSEVIALVPVAINTGHWKNSIYGKATAICFLYDTRLRFLVNGKDGGKGAPIQ